MIGVRAKVRVTVQGYGQDYGLGNGQGETHLPPSVSAGNLLHEEKVEELSLAQWRPQPADRFPAPTDADIPKKVAAAGAAPRRISHETRP